MPLTLQALEPSQVAAAKTVISEGCFEFFGQAPLDFDDMDDPCSHYGSPGETFLVLTDGQTVVGTGAIRRIDDRTCELKRMWLLPAYRGQGHGTRMAGQLLEFSRSAGYQRIRLDTSSVLEAANRLYRKFGFREIERYNNGPCATFMELDL